MKVKVISIFRDKFTQAVYNTGETIEIESEARVEDLVDRRLVEVLEVKKEFKGITLFEKEFEKKDLVEALKTIGAQVTMNMKEETLLTKVAGLGEDVGKLKEALGVE